MHKRTGKILAIMAAVVFICGILGAKILLERPEWDPYLWEYQQRYDASAADEALKNKLRRGLQDIDAVQSADGLSVEVIQTFGSARSISILFKAVLPVEEIDLQNTVFAETEGINPSLSTALLYKGTLKQEDINGLTPYEMEMYHKKERIAVSSNPGHLCVMEILPEENALVCVLERSCYYDVYDDQLLTMIIQGFEVTKDGITTEILTDSPIAVSWHARNRGETLYWHIDGEKVQGEADISAAQLHLTVEAEELLSMRDLLRNVNLLDKEQQPLAIGLNGMSSGSSNTKGQITAMVYLAPLIDVSEIGYLQIGEEIFAVNK